VRYYIKEHTFTLRMAMKTLLIPLTLAVAAVAISGAADASTHRKWHRSHAYADNYPKVYRYRDSDNSIGGYYEHRLDAVRFGSQRWWYIYDEQNGGAQHR
jgi:hypothetical protein